MYMQARSLTELAYLYIEVCVSDYMQPPHPTPTDSESLFNEAEGVTVENVTFEAL